MDVTPSLGRLAQQAEKEKPAAQEKPTAQDKPSAEAEVGRQQVKDDQGVREVTTIKAKTETGHEVNITTRLSDLDASQVEAQGDRVTIKQDGKVVTQADVTGGGQFTRVTQFNEGAEGNVSSAGQSQVYARQDKPSSEKPTQKGGKIGTAESVTEERLGEAYLRDALLAAETDAARKKLETELAPLVQQLNEKTASDADVLDFTNEAARQANASPLASFARGIKNAIAGVPELAQQLVNDEDTRNAVGKTVATEVGKGFGAATVGNLARKALSNPALLNKLPLPKWAKIGVQVLGTLASTAGTAAVLDQADRKLLRGESLSENTLGESAVYAAPYLLPGLGAGMSGAKGVATRLAGGVVTGIAQEEVTARMKGETRDAEDLGRSLANNTAMALGFEGGHQAFKGLSGHLGARSKPNAAASLSGPEGTPELSAPVEPEAEALNPESLTGSESTVAEPVVAEGSDSALEGNLPVETPLAGVASDGSEPQPDATGSAANVDVEGERQKLERVLLAHLPRSAEGHPEFEPTGMIHWAAEVPPSEAIPDAGALLEASASNAHHSQPSAQPALGGTSTPEGAPNRLPQGGDAPPAQTRPSAWRNFWPGRTQGANPRADSLAGQPAPKGDLEGGSRPSLPPVAQPLKPETVDRVVHVLQSNQSGANNLRTEVRQALGLPTGVLSAGQQAHGMARLRQLVGAEQAARLGPLLLGDATPATSRLSQAQQALSQARRQAEGHALNQTGILGWPVQVTLALSRFRARVQDVPVLGPVARRVLPEGYQPPSTPAIHPGKGVDRWFDEGFVDLSASGPDTHTTIYVPYVEVPLAGDLPVIGPRVNRLRSAAEAKRIRQAMEAPPPTTLLGVPVERLPLPARAKQWVQNRLDARYQQNQAAIQRLSQGREAHLPVAYEWSGDPAPAPAAPAADVPIQPKHRGSFDEAFLWKATDELKRIGFSDEQINTIFQLAQQGRYAEARNALEKGYSDLTAGRQGLEKWDQQSKNLLANATLGRYLAYLEGRSNPAAHPEATTTDIVTADDSAERLAQTSTETTEMAADTSSSPVAGSRLNAYFLEKSVDELQRIGFTSDQIGHIFRLIQDGRYGDARQALKDNFRALTAQRRGLGKWDQQSKNLLADATLGRYLDYLEGRANPAALSEASLLDDELTRDLWLDDSAGAQPAAAYSSQPGAAPPTTGMSRFAASPWLDQPLAPNPSRIPFGGRPSPEPADGLARTESSAAAPTPDAVPPIPSGGGRLPFFSRLLGGRHPIASAQTVSATVPAPTAPSPSLPQSIRGVKAAHQQQFEDLLQWQAQQQQSTTPAALTRAGLDAGIPAPDLERLILAHVVAEQDRSWQKWPGNLSEFNRAKADIQGATQAYLQNGPKPMEPERLDQVVQLLSVNPDAAAHFRERLNFTPERLATPGGRSSALAQLQQLIGTQQAEQLWPLLQAPVSRADSPVGRLAQQAHRSLEWARTTGEAPVLSDPGGRGLTGRMTSGLSRLRERVSQVPGVGRVAQWLMPEGYQFVTQAPPNRQVFHEAVTHLLDPGAYRDLSVDPAGAQTVDVAALPVPGQNVPVLGPWLQQERQIAEAGKIQNVLNASTPTRLFGAEVNRLPQRLQSWLGDRHQDRQSAFHRLAEGRKASLPVSYQWFGDDTLAPAPLPADVPIAPKHVGGLNEVLIWKATDELKRIGFSQRQIDTIYQLLQQGRYDEARNALQAGYRHLTNLRDVDLGWLPNRKAEQQVLNWGANQVLEPIIRRLEGRTAQAALPAAANLEPVSAESAATPQPSRSESTASSASTTPETKGMPRSSSRPLSPAERFRQDWARKDRWMQLQFNMSTGNGPNDLDTLFRLLDEGQTDQADQLFAELMSQVKRTYEHPMRPDLRWAAKPEWVRRYVYGEAR